MSEIYKGKSYNLTETQIRGLANICYREQGSNDAGVRACASHMLNYYERYQTKKYSNPFDCTVKSGWYGTESFNKPYINGNYAPQSVVDAVRDVMSGNRSIPSYVDEYDCLSDVASASNNGVSFTPTDRSKYKKDVTKVKNVYGSSWTFFCFPDGANGYTDAFGYISKPSTAETPVTTTVGTNNVSAIIESAISFMEKVAKDASHGYDQTYRWNERGDYDCSSLTITAWEQAGVPVKSKGGAVYTGNMYEVFLKYGFKDVTSTVNLNTGSGMQRGDVLLNHVHHVAMYCGAGKEVEASINERGGATGGTPGDQTGREILIRDYRNYPWNAVLRYIGNGSGATTVSTSSDIQLGDVGDNVKNIQKKLNWLINAHLDEDGEFGELTYNAVIEFQKKYNLEVDGVVGVKTLKKINQLVKERNDAKQNASSKPTSANSNSAKPTSTTTIPRINKQKSDGTYTVNKTVQYVGKSIDNNLNVRSGPGYSYANIVSWPQLEKGYEVEVCDTVTALDGSEWLYICVNSHIYGFVAAQYIARV